MAPSLTRGVGWWPGATAGSASFVGATMASRALIEQILRTIDDSTANEHERGITAPEGSALWMWHNDADFHQSLQFFADLVGRMAAGILEGSLQNAESRRLAETDFRRNQFRIPPEWATRLRAAEDEFIEALPAKVEVVMDTTPLLPPIQDAMRQHPARGEG